LRNPRSEFGQIDQDFPAEAANDASMLQIVATVKEDVPNAALREGWFMFGQIAHGNEAGRFVICFHAMHLLMLR